MTTLAELNTLPAAEAAELFRACCGASRWVERMVARRPFASREALLAAADEVWGTLGESDWREAFAHHPRIGEQRAAVAQDARAAAWSGGEQAGMSTATSDVRGELARLNAEYERRHGFICIICASGRGAAELLDVTRSRIDNPTEAELRLAAEEQRKITRLRLEKLISHPSERTAT